ncbi:hypothetical protein [Thalassotalea crassostreae]|uniref:hypothetical protein n=1 Tax=Thalassotalea crassostreae TaxID=1763536 RepID=UPI000838C110|nr:hypothetical protein [Thalassotalea crassostreae]
MKNKQQRELYAPFFNNSSSLTQVTGKVVKGFQVASGRSNNTPFQAGTVKLQKPFFKALGLDLESYFMATINLTTANLHINIKKPDYLFTDIKWHKDIAAETFSFCACVLEYKGKQYEALFYYPHLETKPDHFQPPCTIEIISPYIESLRYGSDLGLILNNENVKIEKTSKITK